MTRRDLELIGWIVLAFFVLIATPLFLASIRPPLPPCPPGQHYARRGTAMTRRVVCVPDASASAPPDR